MWPARLNVLFQIQSAARATREAISRSVDRRSTLDCTNAYQREEWLVRWVGDGKTFLLKRVQSGTKESRKLTRPVALRKTPLENPGAVGGSEGALTLPKLATTSS